MRSLLLILALLLPTAALADVTTGPVLPGVPEPTSSSASAEEVKSEATVQIAHASRWAPIAVVTPLGVAGISIVASSPFAGLAGDSVGQLAMRSMGLGLMGGGLGAGIAFNTVARTARMWAGGSWTDDLGFLIGGLGAASAGLVLASVASSSLPPDAGTQAGLMVGSAVAWNAGMLMLVVDAVKTGFVLSNQLSTAAWDGKTPQFAGFYVAPELQGASAGLSFRW